MTIFQNALKLLNFSLYRYVSLTVHHGGSIIEFSEIVLNYYWIMLKFIFKKNS